MQAVPVILVILVIPPISATVVIAATPVIAMMAVVAMVAVVAVVAVVSVPRHDLIGISSASVSVSRRNKGAPN